MVSSCSFLLFLFFFKFRRCGHQLYLLSFSIVRNCLAALLKKIDSSSLMLRYKGHLLKLRPPFICDQDGLLCLGNTLSRMTLSQGMLDQ